MRRDIDLTELQAYVDACDDLHDAVGARRGAHLPLAPFARGEYNANFELAVPPGARAARAGGGRTAGRLLVRVNLGSQMHLADQIGYEMAALRLLEPSGRTPRALFVDSSRKRLPFGVGVEELLDGRPLRYGTDLPEAARILADIHALPAPAPGTSPLVAPAHPVADIVAECRAMYAVYRDWPRAETAVLSSVDALFEQVRPLAAADAARPAPARRHIVNTELNSGNFLIRDGAPGYLVDWEKPVLGEVEQDLAHFLVPTTTFWKTDTVLGRSDRAAFLALYEEAVAGRFDTSGTAARLEDYLAATCLRGITWCAMALTEYEEDPARAAAGAATLAKIRAYLEPGFLDSIARDYYGR